MDLKGEPAQRIAMSLIRMYELCRSRAVGVRRSPRRHSGSHPRRAGELAGKQQEEPVGE